MNNNRTINIVTSLNDKYTLYTVVLLTSIFESQTEGYPIQIYILYNSLNEDNKNILQDTVAKYGQAPIEFIHVDGNLFSGFLTNYCWSHEAYFRLMLPDIMPDEMDRLLYLDVDVIVNKDISGMYFEDLTGIDICAQIDVNKQPFEDLRDEFFKEWYEEGSLQYFCSGVTLWNLSRIRENHSFASYIEIAKRLEFKMVAPDQDILNIAHHGYIRIWEDSAKYGLYGKYSYNIGIHYDEVKEYSAIIHYIGQKPWEGQYIHYDIEQLWWDYAKLTPYYYELMEGFLQRAIHDPLVYDTLKESQAIRETLSKQLDESMVVNKKLLNMLNL